MHFAKLIGTRFRIGLLAGSAIALAIACPLTRAQAQYVTLPFGLPNAFGVSGNNIVGYYNFGDNAYLYDGTTLTTLTNPAAVDGFAAFGVQGSNIVGSFGDSGGTTHGFLYNGSTYTQLDDPLPGATATGATGIDGSNIVGDVTDSSNVNHGFLYNGSTWTAIDDPNATGPNGTTSAIGVSGNLVSGTYDDALGNSHGFLYNITTGLYTTVDDPAGIDFVNNLDYNNLTGIFGDNAVGFYYDPLSRLIDAFVYNIPTGNFTTINDPMAGLLPGNGTYLYGINTNYADGIDAVGFYIDGSGEHAFEYVQTPEPGSVSMVVGFGFSCGMIALRRRRKAGSR